MRARGVVVVTLSVVAVAFGAALVLVPPALAQVPAATLVSESTVVLGPVDGDGAFAMVTLSAGWTELGMGPFLPGDRVSFVSPDGNYRVDFELVAGSAATTGSGGGD